MVRNIFKILAIISISLALFSVEGATDKNAEEKAGKLFSTFFRTLQKNYLSSDRRLLQVGGLFPAICPFGIETKIFIFKLDPKNFACSKGTVVKDIEQLKKASLTVQNGFDLIISLTDGNALDADIQDHVLDLAMRAKTSLFIIPENSSAMDFFNKSRKRLLGNNKKEVLNVTLAPLDVKEIRRQAWEHHYIIFQ